MKNAKRSSRNAEVRLIPAVIGVGAILLILKAGGLAVSAQAQTAAPQKAPAAAPAAPAAPVKPAAAAKPVAPAPKPAGADPLAAIDAALPIPPSKPASAGQANSTSPLASDLDGTGVSAAEMDVLSSLSDRRDSLDERQRQLELRAQTIAAAEKRVDGKITDLKTLLAKIETLLGQRDQMEAAQLDSLVKIYSAMKPKVAARVMAVLDDSVRLNVSGRMKPDVMAGILAALPADIAQKLTVELAGRYKMDPEMAGAAAAATNAAGAQASPAAQKPTAPGG
jgi:flagellar motility protein MotE (MotC chaperone)